MKYSILMAAFVLMVSLAGAYTATSPNSYTVSYNFNNADFNNDCRCHEIYLNNGMTHFEVVNNSSSYKNFNVEVFRYTDYTPINGGFTIVGNGYQVIRYFPDDILNNSNDKWDWVPLDFTARYKPGQKSVVLRWGNTALDSRMIVTLK